MAADAVSLSRVERVESTLLSQRLVEKREKEKKICDRADAFALERLGHEYVRINNRTVAIRGAWRRWERWDASGDRLKQASAVQMQSIAVAVEHYVYKLVKCQARLDAYIKRGLFLRSRHQAAEKVLKVVTDVEQAHAVLLAHAESVMQDPERLARMPSAQVSSMRLPAGASVDLQAAASARQQQGAGSPFAAAQAQQQQQQQQQQLQGQTSRTQQLGSSGAQQPGSSAAQLPGPAGTATAAAAPHAFPGALSLSTSATQTDVEPLADTRKARGGGAAAWAGNGGGGTGDDWTRHDAGWGPGGAGADGKGVSSASSVRALISTHPQPFGSPMTVNPLAKLGYVVQVQPGSGQDGRQREAGPVAAAAGQEMERGVATGPSAHAAGGGRPADSGQAAPSPLVLGPDGTLLLGGQRYVVAWAPQGSMGGANALLIPVPAVLPAPPQAALQSAAADATMPAGAEPAAGQQAGLAAAAATSAASSWGGLECGPSGGPSAGPLNPSPQQQQQQRQLQPTYSLDDPPQRPPGSEGYIPPVQPVSLAHLASASLSAAAARQLLACYSPNSATAALESAGRRAWGRSLLPGGGGSGGGSPAARARSGSATASSSEGRGATLQSQASHPLGSSPGGPADAGLSASANAASQRPSPAQAASSTPGAASTRGARASPAHSTTTVSRLLPAPLVTNEPKTARRSLWSRLPPPGAPLVRSRPRTASAAVPTLDAPHRGAAAAAGATAYGSHYGSGGVQAAGLGPDGDAGRKDLRAHQLVASLVAPVSSAVRQSMLLSRYARGGDVVGGVPDGSRRREGGFGAYPSAGGLHLAGRGEDDAGWGRQGREPLGSGDQGHTYLVGATTGSTGDREWAEASAAAARDAVRGAPASGAVAQDLERLEPGGRPAAAPGAAADPAHPSSGGGAGVRAYAAALKAQAEQGSIEAVEELGCLIRSGAPGMPAQPDVAQGLLLYAAESGSASAARMLGEMYATGEGGEQNPDEAEAWLATAREL